MATEARDYKINHILLEIYDWKNDDLNFCKKVMTEASIKMNATILETSFFQFKPQGITIVLLLAESHLSLHSFPENNYCAIDCFTCGSINTDIGIKYLIKQFKSKKFLIKEIIRGI